MCPYMLRAAVQRKLAKAVIRYSYLAEIQTGRSLHGDARRSPNSLIRGQAIISDSSNQFDTKSGIRGYEPVEVRGAR